MISFLLIYDTRKVVTGDRFGTIFILCTYCRFSVLQVTPNLLCFGRFSQVPLHTHVFPAKNACVGKPGDPRYRSSFTGRGIMTSSKLNVRGI